MGFEGAGYDSSDMMSACAHLTYTFSGGRPDVMKLVREAYHAWGAEVVFITSNYQGNKEIMEGCKAEGIPAFVSFPHTLYRIQPITEFACACRALCGISKSFLLNT